MLRSIKCSVTDEHGHSALIYYTIEMKRHLCSRTYCLARFLSRDFKGQEHAEQ
jgi:hypothetical protein